MEKLLNISDENIWEFIIDYFPLSIIAMVIGTALIVLICCLLLGLLFLSPNYEAVHKTV